MESLIKDLPLEYQVVTLRILAHKLSNLISNLKIKLVCLNSNAKEANLENTKNYEILSEVSQTKLICISGIMIQLYTVTALLAEHL